MIVIGSDHGGFALKEEIKKYLQEKDAILVPQSYERYFGAQIVELLHRFRGSLLECNYEMDAGSFLYIQEKTRRIVEEKTL